MLNSDTLWNQRVLAASTRSGAYDVTTREYQCTPATVWGALTISELADPHKDAVVEDSGRSVTYSQLQREVENASANLYSHGIREQSRVGVLVDNSIEFIICLLAINRCGAIAVMLPGKFTDKELLPMVETACVDALVADDSRARVFVADENEKNCVLTVTQLCEHRERPVPGAVYRADAVAIHMFTSGTTGAPKRVVLTNLNIMHALASYEHILGLTPQDRFIFGVALYHVTGVVAVVFTTIFTGATLYLQRRFEPTAFLDWAQQVQATYIHGSPTVFQLLLDSWTENKKLDSVRLLACGAANMPPDRIRKLGKKIPSAQFRTIYGLTETTSPATIFPEDATTSPRIGTSGLPIPGIDMIITDSDGAEVPDGEVGEIKARGTNVSRGYLDTDDSFHSSEWLTTGDLGYLTSEGYLCVVDRVKSQINRGGEKLHPASVENALCAIEGVEDACVVGIPDDLYGEVPAALVVLSADINIAALGYQLIGSVPKYAVPVHILDVDEIPLTPGMKTDRIIARDILAETQEGLTPL